MTEVLVEMVTYRVLKKCEAIDCEGEMRSTGAAYFGDKLLYNHKFNTCGLVATYDKEYPHIRTIPRSEANEIPVG